MGTKWNDRQRCRHDGDRADAPKSRHFRGKDPSMAGYLQYADLHQQPRLPAGTQGYARTDTGSAATAKETVKANTKHMVQTINFFMGFHLLP